MSSSSFTQISTSWVHAGSLVIAVFTLSFYFRTLNLNRDLEKRKKRYSIGSHQLTSSEKISSSFPTVGKDENLLDVDDRCRSPAPRKDQCNLAPGQNIKGTFEIIKREINDLKTYFDSANFPNNNSSYYNKFVSERDVILHDVMFNISKQCMETEAFPRAGPREYCHFDPMKVRAAIVTCGGLCPGLNNVIREITRSLLFLYNVEKIIGVVGGYQGFLGKKDMEPMELNLQNTRRIHQVGGTMLSSSRGGFDVDKIIEFLQKNGINQLYIIGGDGTHRGADKIASEVIKRSLNISVIGIPKTIDNDIDLIDRSFGFQTSVEAAQAAIRSAKTEAMCNRPNGIGIVKLMGRSAGFIAVHATLSSGDVDLCLIPEQPIELEGERGCLPFLLRRVKKNGHAVIVVAEGAGEELLGQSTETDAGGNRKLPKIGEFMKAQIESYFKKNDEVATVKYIDPSYMIRSVAANSNDAFYCMLLAQNAVHGAMAGYTAFSVGLINNRLVYIPISRLTATSPRILDPSGRTWERILALTRQPSAKRSKYEESSITVKSNVVV